MGICHISGHAIFCCLSVFCTFRYCSALIFFLQLFTVLGQRAWRETGDSVPIHLLAGKTTCIKHSMGNYLYTVAFQTQNSPPDRFIAYLAIQKKRPLSQSFLVFPYQFPFLPLRVIKEPKRRYSFLDFCFTVIFQCRNSAIIPLPMTCYPDMADLNDSSICQARFQHFRHDIPFRCKPDETGDRFLFTS